MDREEVSAPLPASILAVRRIAARVGDTDPEKRGLTG
jgi:hypothetical protein